MADKLETVIRTMAVQVARLDERSEATNTHLTNIDNKIGTQNGRIDKLESLEDKRIGAKTSIGISAAIVTFIIGTAYGIAKLAGGMFNG